MIYLRSVEAKSELNLAKEKTPPTDHTASKKKSGLIGFIVLAGVSMLSSFGLNYLVFPEPPGAAATCEATIRTGDAVAAPVRDIEHTYTMIPEILITIGSTPADRYLKLNLAIATPKGKAKDVKSAELALADAFNTYLRSIETSDFENPDHYTKMREELAWRAELVLGESVSKGVLITEFLLR